MLTPLEPWQVAQLERLAKTDPARAEAAFNALWDAQPELLAQITLAAVDNGDISLDRAARILDIEAAGADGMLTNYRREALKRSCIIVSAGQVAYLAASGLPVWEVVRVYRRLESLGKLQEAFAGVSQQTLESALNYARENPAEIDALIQDHDHEVGQRMAALSER